MTIPEIAILVVVIFITVWITKRFNNRNKKPLEMHIGVTKPITPECDDVCDDLSVDLDDAERKAESVDLNYHIILQNEEDVLVDDGKTPYFFRLVMETNKVLYSETYDKLRSAIDNHIRITDTVPTFVFKYVKTCKNERTMVRSGSRQDIVVAFASTVCDLPTRTEEVVEVVERMILDAFAADMVLDTQRKLEDDASNALKRKYNIISEGFSREY